MKLPNNTSVEHNDFDPDTLLLLLAAIFLFVSCAEAGRQACGCCFWILLAFLGAGLFGGYLVLSPEN